ncbi:hypothetical protein COO60DRAFT_1701175 [Scenedesmus sp. NREL 46B-D3]|nr:hypothetical protein COO60DRAFT_1701175 [Scenedesmus sp. NREL 46B-D3]
MLAQDKMLVRCSGRRVPALINTRGAHVLSSRRCQTVKMLPIRALPKPTGDVINEDDSAVLIDLEQRFKMADIDGSGRIDRAELKVLLESVQGGLAYPLMVAEGWLPDDALDRAMEKYDIDKSGDIDFDEFKQLVYDGMLLEGAIQEYEDAFNAVDDSGNGSIGATELSQLFKNLGTPLSLERVAEVFMRYDKDESGQIEFGEFLSMFQDQLLDLKKVQAWLASRGEEAWAWGGAASSLLQTVEGNVSVIFTAEELEEALSNNPEKLVVVFCGLTWCRPCKGVGKPYEKLAATYAKSAVFLKLFGNANAGCKQLFKAFKIRSTPSFLYFRAGELIGSSTGANKIRLETNLRSHLLQDGLPEPLYELEPVETAPAAATATI